MESEPKPPNDTVVFLAKPGDVLDDRWRIETRIGRGAMGSVFKGRDLEQDWPVAIKILAPEHCRKKKVLARFEREAKLMATLRHPNIIQILGVGRRGALPYIVMPFLEGMTLHDVLKHKGGKLSPGETMAVVKQISAGLSFVHHHDLVHRDIKPQNIFLGPGGHLTILDLGVVRDSSQPGLTKPGAMVGTPYYMAPEQITGSGQIDKRTDVYALAAMTFELLVGRPPFLGANNFEVLYAHRNEAPPDASTLAKNIGKNAAKALMRGMAKTREDRPQSASEFYADLEAFFGQAEKVDPAVAFAFLEEEAEKSRQREKATVRAGPERETVVRARIHPGPDQPPVRASAPTKRPAERMPPDAAELDDEEPTMASAKPGASPEQTRADEAENATEQTGDADETDAESDAATLTAAKSPTARTRAEVVGIHRAHAGESEPRPSLPSQTDGSSMLGTSAELRSGPQPRISAPSSGPSDEPRPSAPPPAIAPAPSAGAFDGAEEEPTLAPDSSPARPEDAQTDTQVPVVSDDSELGAAPDAPTGENEIPIAQSGELRIITTVKGLTTPCAVFVDDRPQGNSPRSLELPEGLHVVRVERPGFQPAVRAVVLAPKNVTLIRLELVPLET